MNENYNYFTWWLATSIKHISYKIWRYIMTPIMFILWVVGLSSFQDLYWQISAIFILPAVVIDLVWNGITFYFYKKKSKINSCETSDNII